jgi:hypothetical protein
MGRRWWPGPLCPSVLGRTAPIVDRKTLAPDDAEANPKTDKAEPLSLTEPTMLLNHPGHIRQPNGSLIRLDIESGHYVGRYYAPDRHVKARVVGSLAHVQATMSGWS